MFEVQVQDQDGKIILSGAIDPKTELYMISLVPESGNTFQKGDTTSNITGKNKQEALSAITIKTVPALINWYHTCLGSPVIKTWIKGINLHWFQSWPGLSAQRVRGWECHMPCVSNIILRGNSNYGYRKVFRPSP